MVMNKPTYAKTQGALAAAAQTCNHYDFASVYPEVYISKNEGSTCVVLISQSLNHYRFIARFHPN
jgi:hypothetical protein